LVRVLNEIDDWINNDIGFGIRGFPKWIKSKKISILRIVLWSLFIALIIAKTYWFEYLDNPVLIEYRIFFTNIAAWVPKLQILDYIGIIFVNLVAGFLVIDFEKIIIEWVAASLLSFIFSITWAFLFMWYTLGGGVLSVAGLFVGSSYVISFAILNIFRMIFPFALMYSFTACLMGAFIAETFGFESSFE